jgi:hypothetical protein
VKAGVKEVFFENLRYAQHAVDSYKDFIALRREGKIRKGVRFQVSLPTPHGAAGWWFCEPGDYEKVYPAYEKAMIREVEMICDRIPQEDVAIQWDVWTSSSATTSVTPTSVTGTSCSRRASGSR